MGQVGITSSLQKAYFSAKPLSGADDGRASILPIIAAVVSVVGDEPSSVSGRKMASLDWKRTIDRHPILPLQEKA
jgi:hypothetical protein